MKPIDDNQMLQFISKCGEMGVRNIGRVLAYPMASDIRKDLCEQREEYRNIYERSRNMLRHRGQRPKGLHPALNLASAIHVKAEMRHDRSSGGIADMMIHGNKLGLKKSIQRLSHYRGHSEPVRTLAVELMRVEKNGIEVMKNYL
ncbi:MAG: hypothetical protein IKY33_04480 [Clostridia bacterium]|nr:hypothetical protein [Clostridia bacterium]